MTAICNVAVGDLVSVRGQPDSLGCVIALPGDGLALVRPEGRDRWLDVRWADLRDLKVEPTDERRAARRRVRAWTSEATRSTNSRTNTSTTKTGS